MPRDIELTQDTNSNFNINFENGDFKLTDGLDTAIFMSVFAEKRASKTQVKKPTLRRGHFSNEFNDIENYQVGNTGWLNIDQAPNTKNNLTSLENAFIEGLRWLNLDQITSSNTVIATKATDKIDVQINLEGEDEEDSTSYNAFINTVK